jgi:hypothetical protein
VVVTTVPELASALPLALPIGRHLVEDEGGLDAEAHDSEEG